MRGLRASILLAFCRHFKNVVLYSNNNRAISASPVSNPKPSLTRLRFPGQLQRSLVSQVRCERINYARYRIARRPGTRLTTISTLGDHDFRLLPCPRMASSSIGYFPPIDHGGSSSRSPGTRPTVEDHSDDDDPIANHAREQALLSHDPLNDEGDIVSFRRKTKALSTFTLPSFLAVSEDGRKASPTRNGAPRATRNQHRHSSSLGNSRNHPHDGGHIKDGSHDWYAEGPGRRVGYEDLTAIDWIFEYTKERQRLKRLYAGATGLAGYARQILDSSQIWVLLILTGLAVGLVAAGIDVASDWLGDLKTGYCSAGDDGGRFYLNKYFCCWGYDEYVQCQDWVSWSNALHVTSAGGTWFIEYIFFVVYSVSLVPPIHIIWLRCFRLYLQRVRVSLCNHMRYMPSIVVYLRSKRF